MRLIILTILGFLGGVYIVNKGGGFKELTFFACSVVFILYALSVYYKAGRGHSIKEILNPFF